MEKECLHEIKNMKNAVVFSSKTGNTKQLADEIRNVLPEEKIFWFSGDSSFGCRLLLCWILDG